MDKRCLQHKDDKLPLFPQRWWERLVRCRKQVSVLSHLCSSWRQHGSYAWWPPCWGELFPPLPGVTNDHFVHILVMQLTWIGQLLWPVKMREFKFSYRNCCNCPVNPDAFVLVRIPASDAANSTFFESRRKKPFEPLLSGLSLSWMRVKNNTLTMQIFKGATSTL